MKALVLALALSVPGVAAAQPAPAGAAAQAQTRSVARMEGVWIGTFRRYDAAGLLVETLPSEIHIRFPSTGPYGYHQTNVLKGADGKEQRIESYGAWDGPVLRFSNPRVEGWYADVEADPAGLNSVLSLTFKDGSGLTLSELITLSPDGRSRMRAAQYSIGGKLVRRTLIDETRRP